ncbi:MAG: iron-sulfur cluster assembly scaffold protein [Planctomycetes bacterium]|nr:iron-sulfur cluster assembly scaffold protein [Planctomycetota bacterium]
MVSAPLRQLLLAAEGAGELAGDDVRRGAAEHPVCGDRVEVFVRTRGGRIDELRWRASGCPAAMAVTALAAKVLTGTAAPAAAATLHAAIDAHGGLAVHERHAEALVGRALAAAGL